MGKFASEAKEATPMKFAKMTLRYKENTDGENIGEALYFLAQKLVEEADKELAVKLSNHDFSFRVKPVSCPTSENEDETKPVSCPTSENEDETKPVSCPTSENEDETKPVSCPTSENEDETKPVSCPTSENEDETKPVSCPVLLDSEKQNEFEKACKEKSLNAKELVNDFCDYVIKAENKVKKETVITNFIDDFLKREDKSLIEEYQKICDTEEVTVEQTVRALITNTVETGVFPFLFNRDEYTSYQDILKQLEITINQPIQMQTGQLSGQSESRGEENG